MLLNTIAEKHPSFINELTEEAVDTENMDTEGDDAEEVADEAGENSGISYTSSIGAVILQEFFL